MLEKCKEEITALKEAESKGAAEFLKHISDKYVSYLNKKVEFSEDDLKAGNLKKTLRKATIYYHSDKQKTLPNWAELFDE